MRGELHGVPGGLVQRAVVGEPLGEPRGAERCCDERHPNVHAAIVEADALRVKRAFLRGS
ncbi:hypothetical protein SF12_20395 [Streptomyces sp. MBRL 601]|nr:hypothetical protein SF12_20395 [Streptomyces sp. MBRL 601]